MYAHLFSFVHRYKQYINVSLVKTSPNVPIGQGLIRDHILAASVALVARGKHLICQNFYSK